MDERQQEAVFQQIDRVEKYSEVLTSRPLYAVDNSSQLFYMVNNKEKEEGQFSAYKLLNDDGSYGAADYHGNVKDIFIGYLIYKKARNQEHDESELDMIVTNFSNMGMGVGTYLIKNYEKMVFEELEKPVVRGKFYPNPGCENAALRFYLRNGYKLCDIDEKRKEIVKEIEVDDYEKTKDNILTVGGVEIFGSLDRFKTFSCPEIEEEDEMYR